jgi:hypothetical protein
MDTHDFWLIELFSVPPEEKLCTGKYPAELCSCYVDVAALLRTDVYSRSRRTDAAYSGNPAIEAYSMVTEEGHKYAYWTRFM